MKKLLLSLGLILMGFVGMGQVLIAGWDFQTAPGTVIVGLPNTQTSYTANVGAGTLSLNGSNGSSTWLQANELDSFTGTALNAGGATGLSIATPTTSSLALQGGALTAANGKFAVFSVNMTGYQNLVITYATRGTANGFTSQVWEYSPDGTTWSSVGTITGITTSFVVKSLPAISGLNNISTAFVRLTVLGATSATGNNRLDNIQFNADAIPLPVTLISFKAILNERQQATLKWATASEFNNDFFEIERSKNATDFESLGKIVGRGTVQGQNDYTFTDETPLKGINYYRLKQVDYDGQFSYSRLSSVIKDGDGTISLFPNPTANVLKINFEDVDQIENVTFYNAFGRVVKTVSGKQDKYEVTDLPVGKYVLQIRLADGREVRNVFLKN
jgi:Secretion system C-terminal sorting domain